MSGTCIGSPVDRVDGKAKVTGSAKYSGEFRNSEMLYGYVVSSAIAKGNISSIDCEAASNVAGVVEIFTHDNIPRLGKPPSSYSDDIAPTGWPFRPLYDKRIYFSGQPVALVVAETFESARFAASLVEVDYTVDRSQTSLEANFQRRRKSMEKDSAPPKPRGKADKAFAAAPIKVDQVYRAPAEHHNPMELFATSALWEEDGSLTVYDKTQGSQNVSRYLSKLFNLPPDKLRVVSKFVGGAFGSGLRPQYNAFLAVMAATTLGRSVRVTLTRQQMWSLGFRPAVWQRVALGASKSGMLQAVIHEGVAETSSYEDYTETMVDVSAFMYRSQNARFDHKLVPLDYCTPMPMRGPGAAWGMYALECAMDELAVKLGMDPIDLRLLNYADIDQNKGVPFSSKELRECYRQGAERFGWSRKSSKPGSMREGSELVGWGMAGGVWEAQQESASAEATLQSNGTATVSCATADIGTGTYTIMTQIAADELGLPLDRVTFNLGDSWLPKAPVEGGSFTASTVGSAVKAVCRQIRQRLFALARKMPDSPFRRAKFSDVEFNDGHLSLANESGRKIPYSRLMQFAQVDKIQEKATTGSSEKQKKFSRYAHSAVFAEVRVDEDLGTIKVSRVVSAIAGGRIINPKTARSQLMGGVVWGIGMALEEESVPDHRFGRFMTHNLADYHVAVNADIHDIDILFVEEHDDIVNPLGAKGLGELGLVGVASAIANAIYHATGQRIRELPIKLDKIIGVTE